MSLTFVVEQSVAELLGPPHPALRVAARRRTSRWSLRPGGWRALDPAAALDAIVDAPAPLIVLARTVVADGGSGCLRSLARVLEVDVMDLPDDIEDAAWSVAIATRLADAEPEHVARALGVVCCGPSAFAGLPTRLWGPHDRPVPALRPVTLARWSSCVWRHCTWCRGGGFPGTPCRRCGNPIATTGVAAFEEAG
jgi:hypothetical protein